MADQLKQVTWKLVVKNGHRHNKVRADDCALLGYEAMSMGNQFLTFCGNEVSLCSGSIDATVCSPQCVAAY
jgi:hypothetical protein